MELQFVVPTIIGILCAFKKGYCSDDEDALVKELLSRYNRLIRPVRFMNESVDVDFTLTLSLIIDVQEKEQVMKTNVWLQFIWTDPQLMWDPGTYGGIQSIRLPVEKIWTPDVVLINNADGKYMESFKSNIIIRSDGNMLWIPPSIYESTCDIRVQLFPFDEQICDMKFQSWTYNADEVMLRFNPGINYIVIDNNYYPSGAWDVVNAPGFINIYKKSEKEPRTVDITYKLIIRRKTLFYTVNLLIPTILVSFLSMLVFFMPTVAGEKIALSISILLTLNVFILLVSKLLPPASDLPLIGQFLLFTFLMNLVSIVATVVTINLNFRSPKTHTMPPWLRRVFLGFLPTILLMRRPKKYNPFENISVKLRSRHPAQDSNESNHKKRTFRSLSPRTTSDGYLEGLEVMQLGSAEALNHHETAGMRFFSTLPAFGNRIVDHRQSRNYLESQRSQEIDENEAMALRSPDARLVTSCIESIVQYHHHNDSIQDVEDDWKYVALVVDRLLLWIFFIATTIGSIRILLSADTIFETLEEAKKRSYF